MPREPREVPRDDKREPVGGERQENVEEPRGVPAERRHDVFSARSKIVPEKIRRLRSSMSSIVACIR